MDKAMTESRFHMWRAVFAMAYADGFLSLDEQGKLYNVIETRGFSEEQKEMLRDDVAEPQDIDAMFASIEDPADRVDFFRIARVLVWCDGDMDAQEEAILERLKQKYGIEEVGEELEQSREHSFTEKFRHALENFGFGHLIENLTGKFAHE